MAEYSRNVLKLKDANSTEFNAETKNPVIALITEWNDISGKKKKEHKILIWGHYEIGCQLCKIKKGSKVHKMYKCLEIVERHRHRYEVNPLFKEHAEKADLNIVGTSIDGNLVEMI